MGILFKMIWFDTKLVGSLFLNHFQRQKSSRNMKKWRRQVLGEMCIWGKSMGGWVVGSFCFENRKGDVLVTKFERDLNICMYKR